MSEKNIFNEFWQKYPKKIGKKAVEKKFQTLGKKIDEKNLFLGLDLYLEKWKKEETPIQFIPNPLTFINQERYYDEIIILEEKKEKYKKILEEKKEEKIQEMEEKKAKEIKQKLIFFYNSLKEEEKKEIIKKAEEKIKNENFKLYEKKGVFYESLKKIYIRKILNDLFFKK